MTFLTIFGVTEILCSFKWVLEGKIGKEIPESSRLEFLEKFSANNFALSDAEDSTSGPLNRGGIVDLSLLRTLSAICQKSQQPSFWEIMDCFVLLAYFVPDKHIYLKTCDAITVAKNIHANSPTNSRSLPFYRCQINLPHAVTKAERISQTFIIVSFFPWKCISRCITLCFHHGIYHSQLFATKFLNAKQFSFPIS